jgi:release factor glutamine methyltransferase
VENN